MKRKVRGSPKGRTADPQALEDVRGLLGDAPRRRDLLIEHLHRINDRFGHLPAAHGHGNAIASQRRDQARCIAGHRSVEPGAAAVLDELGLVPVLDLNLRLGEGSGACLALPIVEAAARILAEMATFDAAGVTDKDL